MLEVGIMKEYYVIYKEYKQPKLGHFIITAQNKNEAKLAFLSSGIKHDYIIKVIL